MSKKRIYIINLLFPLIIYFLFQMLFIIFNSNIQYNLNIFSISFNIFIIYLFWFLFLAITKTSFRTNLILFIILLIYFIVNLFKLYYTSEALTFNEIKMANETNEIFDLIKNDFLSSLWDNKIVIIILIFSIVLFIKLFKKFDTKKIKNKLVNMFYISIIFIIILVYPNNNKNNFIIKYSLGNKKIIKINSVNKQYNSYGLIGGLYYNYISSINYKDNKTTDSDIKAIYNEIKEEKNAKEFKKPNIIVMFTEAFWDITTQNTITFSTDPLKEYHELKKDAIVIDSLSPTFGSKSANTEFEFITGASLSFYSMDTIGFKTFYNNKESKNNPTIIKELKNNGYKTEILNSASGELYNCDLVYKNWDVDKVTHLKDDLGYFVKDAYLVDKLIETFNNKQKDERLFYMTISMESHLPYKLKNNSNYDFEITSHLPDSSKNLIKSYTQSIRNASLQLKRAYDYIQTLDEDTIIIFFGDHLPILKSLNRDLYNTITEFNTGNILKDTYKKYNIETLILSNYDINYDNIKTASFDMIFTTIINNMDINISNYYKWVYQTRKELPSMNGLVAKDLDGNLYDINNLPNDMKTIYNKRKKVQNYLFK